MGKHSPRFLQLVDEVRPQIQECTVDEVKNRIARGEELNLVDVREESEWAKGHLPTAVHLGKGIIERDVEQQFPDPQTELVLYCGGGFRSALAAYNLQKMGYQNVISMDGGFRGWKDAGLPVVQP
jgi:rhodanese-related sulfurtransferase